MTRFDASWVGRLTGNEMRVLSKISDYIYTSGRCFAADGTIAAHLGLSRGGVNRILAGLEDRELNGEGMVRSVFHPRTGTMERWVKHPAPDALAVCVSGYSRDQLPGTRFAVYCYLSLRQMLPDPTPIRRIAADCSLSEATARDAVADLVASGWLTRYGAAGCAFRYTVHPAPVAGIAAYLADPTPTSSVTGPPHESVTSAPPGSVIQTGPLDQALVIRQEVVVGGCSRVAATSVPRDAGTREPDRAPAARPGRGRGSAGRTDVNPGRRPWPAGGRLPQDVQQALHPVAALWSRVRPGARAVVVAAARSELNRISVWSGTEHASEVLRERLGQRLENQERSARVTDPVGWLLRRGLPQRVECPRPSCDGGIRLDTGGDCETCRMRVADRRSVRRILAAEIAAERPDADRDERRDLFERRLQDWTGQRARWRAAALQLRHNDDLRRAEVLAERRARERVAAAARQAVACEGCGAANSCGLCPVCSGRRVAKEAIVACVDHAIAGNADLDNPAEIVEWARRTRAELRDRMLSARAPGAHYLIATASDQLVAQHAADEFRVAALRILGRHPAADREADQAREACLRAAHHYPDRRAAVTAADNAGACARRRAAEYLLAERLQRVEVYRRGGPTAAVQPAPTVTGQS
ncbi:hypothetical protein AB0D08_06740 [Kitasatospora sp. NPDC048540]|uniref:hypothetical protein n=1 Tax=Kitasatospora sp. NPDC048540 TaxID=3155634 RepID=UPI0033C3EA24